MGRGGGDTARLCMRRAMRCCKSAKTCTRIWVREKERERGSETEKELYETQKPGNEILVFTIKS